MSKFLGIYSFQKKLSNTMHYNSYTKKPLMITTEKDVLISICISNSFMPNTFAMLTQPTR